MIKQLQGGTRVLQHICAHAKVERDQRVFKLGPLSPCTSSAHTYTHAHMQHGRMRLMGA